MPTVAVAGINIYYEIHGEGEPLVFIGGLGTDVTPYQGMIRELSSQYQVIAFDNRGVGRTDKPDIPYSIEMMADDTAGLMSALGIERAHILGVSMGGRIAVALALRHPEMARSLVLVSTFVRRFPMPWLGRLLIAVRMTPLLRTMGRKYPQPNYALVRQRRASRDHDASDRLHEVRVPVLIVHGRKDRLAPLRLAEEMHAGIRGSELVTFDGGHLFLFFRQKQFVDAVLDFLTSRTAPSPNSG